MIKLTILKITLVLLLIPFFGIGKSREKLLMSGCNWDKVVVVDKLTGAVEWTHQLQKGDDCNDVEITKAGNILYAYKGGARLVNRAQDILWDFKVEKGQELYTATELPSGEYLLAVCANPSRIITLDSEGVKINELNFDSGITNVHGQFRQILPTRKNTFIIPLMGKGEVIELNRSGQIIRSVAVGGNPFSVKLMHNGNWLVGCGDAHKFVMVDPVKCVVKQSVATDNVAGASLLFVAEPHSYRNGNVMIANWNGHSKDKTQPSILELDADNHIVWSLPSIDNNQKVSAFFPFKSKK